MIVGVGLTQKKALIDADSMKRKKTAPMELVLSSQVKPHPEIFVSSRCLELLSVGRARILRA